jgi:phthiodiolone/phenolphthiodiolone dimycocerosates ketoreductase
MLEQSGVVDYFWTYDQLTSWFPKVLWRPENTPLAETAADCDSFYDGFLLGAIAGAATSKLGVQMGGTDSVRNGPAELCQKMYTLAALTEGRAWVGLGAGEVKQHRPFGYKRSEALGRMEDILRIARLFWECDGPIDFDGNYWKLRNAYLGGIRSYRPEFWCMGGGPKLIDLSARYADGMVGMVPGVWPSPDQFAKHVAAVREQVERAGRDPDEFGFGIMAGMLLHEDGDVLERAFENPLVKWQAAIWGRHNPADWAAEGLEPVFPPGVSYPLHVCPAEITDGEVQAILAKVSRTMVEKSFLCGTPADAAKALQPYVEAGATHVGVCDLLPLSTGLEEAMASIGRLLDICEALKGS